MKKGDSAEMPDNRCTPCIKMSIACTHTRTKTDEASPSSVERTKSVQAEVARIASNSLLYTPPADLATCQRLLKDMGLYARSLEEALAIQPPAEPQNREGEGFLIKYSDPGLDNTVFDPLTAYPETDRCYGIFSSQEFSRSAIRQTAATGQTLMVGIQRPEYWKLAPVERLHFIFCVLTCRISGKPRLWMRALLSSPDKSLMETLVDIYFDQINPIWSLLHAPSFRQSMAEGLHFSNRVFGTVVLAVCSLASRYSDDPRVLLSEHINDPQCSGWKWFGQIRPERVHFSLKEYLYQLQAFALSCLYIASTSSPDQVWFLIGMGVRFSQSIGLHVQSSYDKMPPLEAELCKRAFWLLLLWDALMGAIKARPTTSRFSLDLPLACDDKYWAVPESMPTTLLRPSINEYYVVHLRLLPIIERIQRVAHPSNGDAAPESVIIELDSDLNKWLHEIPDHLKWDPNQQEQIFLDQSAILYTAYYHAQILIHRPFLSSPGNDTSPKPTFPSMAICANAARSLGHVLNIQARRGRGILYSPYILSALFDAAVVLLIHVWTVIGRKGTSSDGAGRSPQPTDFERATADVQNCGHVLRLYEKRWRIAGRYYDIINAVLNIGRLSTQKMREKRQEKRSRDEGEEGGDSGAFASPTSTSTNNPGPDSSQAAPGESLPATTPPSVDEQLDDLQRSMQETEHLFSLPFHTDELGRLPVYSSWKLTGSHNYNGSLQYPVNGSSEMLDWFAPEVELNGVPAAESASGLGLGASAATQNSAPSGNTVPVGLKNPATLSSWDDWLTYLVSANDFVRGSS
ncbi:Fungal-trans domain-containing protein [Mycena kentingensis (nom. inval.)]|nr:Fungal-trans domain-containing protein [Mycena kentingensis (nom. inval.)]